MNDIDLQEAKIKFEGEWFSVEDLTGMIKEKMDAGDMKLSALAKALEELNTALENSHTIEAKIVIPTADYKKLIELGGEDDLNCVRQAVMAFVGGRVEVQPASEPAAEPEGKKVKTVKCTKCKAAIDIPADEVPSEIKCPECGTTGRLKSQNKS